MKNRIFLDMYSRVRRNSRKQLVIKGLVLASIIALITLFSTNTVNTGSFLTVSEIREAESKVEIKPVSIKLPVKETKVLAEEKVETTEGKVEAQPQEAPAPAAPEAPAVQVAYTPQAAPVNYAQANTAYPTVLANGNSAGAVGSEAAAQMAAATGVPQATWEYIIARESNGNPSAANPSGASGLFQTMPGWGSTATVQDQINSAINAYNNQGLAAWGM